MSFLLLSIWGFFSFPYQRHKKPHIMKRVVRCYYERQPNYGDLLTGPLLNHYAHRVDSDFQLEQTYKPREAHIVGIGSILSNVSSNYTGYIWTTGTARPNETKTLPSAKLVSVRGKHSRTIASGGNPEGPVGDGGLLMSRVYGQASPSDARKYALGIIPHVVDYSAVKGISGLNNDPRVLIINLEDSVDVVTRQIKNCQRVLSSSLHGLIVADSFRIPNHRFTVSTSNQIIGGSYKFNDYYSCFGIGVPSPIALKKDTKLSTLLTYFKNHAYQRPGLEGIITSLENATLNMFRELKETIPLSTPVTKKPSTVNQSKPKPPPPVPVKRKNAHTSRKVHPSRKPTPRKVAPPPRNGKVKRLVVHKPKPKPKSKKR
jgi:pyruvyltransferase